MCSGSKPDNITKASPPSDFGTAVTEEQFSKALNNNPDNGGDGSNGYLTVNPSTLGALTTMWSEPFEKFMNNPKHEPWTYVPPQPKMVEPVNQTVPTIQQAQTEQTPLPRIYHSSNNAPLNPAPAEQTQPPQTSTTYPNPHSEPITASPYREVPGGKPNELTLDRVSPGSDPYPKAPSAKPDFADPRNLAATEKDWSAVNRIAQLDKLPRRTPAEEREYKALLKDYENTTPFPIKAIGRVIMGTGRWGANKALDGTIGGTAFVNESTRRDLEKVENGSLTTARRHNNTLEGAQKDLARTVERNDAFIRELIDLKGWVNENGPLDLTAANGPGEKLALDLCEKLPGVVMDNLIMNTVGLVPDLGMDLVGNFGRQYETMTRDNLHTYDQDSFEDRMIGENGQNRNVSTNQATLYSAGSAITQTALVGVVKRVPSLEPLEGLINLSYEAGGELMAEALRQGLEFPDSISYVQERLGDRIEEKIKNN